MIKLELNTEWGQLKAATAVEHEEFPELWDVRMQLLGAAVLRQDWLNAGFDFGVYTPAMDCFLYGA